MRALEGHDGVRVPRWAVEADLCIEMGWTREQLDAEPVWWVERLMCFRELRGEARKKG